MNNKDNDIEMLNELVFENESNTLEMLNQTESFFRMNERNFTGEPNDSKLTTELYQ